MRKKELPPETKKRNRILVTILIIIVLTIAIFTAQGIYKTDFNREKLEEFKHQENTH
jgi:hypothetical protein